MSRISRNNPFSLVPEDTDHKNHKRSGGGNIFTNSFEDEEDDDRRWSIANHQEPPETGNFINEIHDTQVTFKEYEVTADS
jgi:hypothetical protein